jgi:DNA-binding response OmpR family regulator
MRDKARILVVEDEMPVARAMLLLLMQAGCKTQVATTGAMALQMAQENHFDLITLDIDLPDADGLSLCRRLKKSPALSEVPVIFVTARLSNQDMLDGLEAGAVDYITKPFGAQDFVRRILSRLSPTEAIA